MSCVSTRTIERQTNESKELTKANTICQSFFSSTLLTNGIDSFKMSNLLMKTTILQIDIRYKDADLSTTMLIPTTLTMSKNLEDNYIIYKNVSYISLSGKIVTSITENLDIDF